LAGMGTGYLKKILYAGLGTAFYRDERPCPAGNTDLAAITLLQLFEERSLSPATSWETEAGVTEDKRGTGSPPLSQESSAVVTEPEAGAGESGEGKITEEGERPRESRPEADGEVNVHPDDHPAGTMGAVPDVRGAADSGTVPAGMKGEETMGLALGGGAASAAAVPFVYPLRHDDNEGVPVIEVVRRDELPLTDNREPVTRITQSVGMGMEPRESTGDGTAGEHGIPESRNEERLKDRGGRPVTGMDGGVESPGVIRGYRTEAGTTSIQRGTAGVSAHSAALGTGQSGVAASFTELITRPEEHVNTLPYLFNTSSGKEHARISQIAEDIERLGEKLDNHIRGGERVEAPVFLRKRPASYDLGGWRDTERRYIR